MVRVPIHTVSIHALDGLMQQKYLLCSAALPSHPILPCQLNSNVVETATFSSREQSQGMNHDVSQPLTVLPSPPWTSVRKWFHIGMVFTSEQAGEVC